MKTRLHKSSESHQRVAKHFREELSEIQANQGDVPASPSLFSGCYFSCSGKSHFYSSLYIPFQNAALISLQMRRKIGISRYSCPAPWEKVCFSLIFFTVSASPPRPTLPCSSGRHAVSYWDGTTVQRHGTTRRGGARRGRGSGGQMAFPSGLGKLDTSVTPCLLPWATFN